MLPEFYWEKRHSLSASPLQATGIKSFSNKANECRYELIKSRLQALTPRLTINEGFTVLDAGCGSGYFSRFWKERGARVTALDFSPSALGRMNEKNWADKIIQAKIEDFRQGCYDIVHCFDVLSHILSDEAFIRALQNLSAMTDSYLILHDSFPFAKAFWRPAHLKLRTYNFWQRILSDCGMENLITLPTAFFCNLFTYRLFGFFPKTLYGLEMRLLEYSNRLCLPHPSSSTAILVFIPKTKKLYAAHESL